MDWMRRLAKHYERARERYPGERLIVLFDIDGTILDMRYAVRYALRGYDAAHGTRYFSDLTVNDVTVHEDRVEGLLDRPWIPEDRRAEIMAWSRERRWSEAAMMESHRPFHGVMAVIRWFQIQENTYVGLNTGRPDTLREATLRSLNQLGAWHKVTFSGDLLFMNRRGWHTAIEEAKSAAIEACRAKGFRVVAFVDNEPKNLDAVARVDPGREILLLHADTIFESGPALPHGAERGRAYDITELVQEQALPRHIELVWHGVNDARNLRQFMASNVRWAELDLRLNEAKDDIVLRHDPIDPEADAAEPAPFAEVMDEVMARGRSAKLDLKENGPLLERLPAALARWGPDESRLWINGEIGVVGERGFRKLRAAYPGAILQCSIDFVAPLVGTMADRAKEILDEIAGWGVNRFSIGWRTLRREQVLGEIQAWGFEVNIYDAPDLESFLEAVMLLPTSVTADFNFPKWRYFGQGSGENGGGYEYLLRPAAPAGV